jgi:hypothetical protein
MVHGHAPAVHGRAPAKIVDRMSVRVYTGAMNENIQAHACDPVELPGKHRLDELLARLTRQDVFRVAADEYLDPRS